MFRLALLITTSIAAAPPTSTIINGTPQAGDLAVVALVDAANPTHDVVACTGTLVSRHVVVAAGHCVNFPPFAAPTYVYFGSDPATGGAFVRAKSTAAHPDYLPEYTSDGRIENDISVVILDEAAPDTAQPYPLASVAPTPGASARFVGFGCREATGACGPYGEKYEVTAAITAVNDRDFDYGVATCNGDSGGPAFVLEAGHEVLAGVTSTGDNDCAAYGTDTRVDAFAPWVRGIMAREDPDTCLGVDCPCVADGVCSVACARPGNDPDCPADCGADGSCDHECPERDPDCPAPLPDRASCRDDHECASDVCEGVCRPLCDPGAPMCAMGLACEEQRFGAYACVTHGGGCSCRVGGAPAGGSSGRRVGVLALLVLAACVLGSRRCVHGPVWRRWRARRSRW